jgi:hypothetical protein
MSMGSIFKLARDSVAVRRRFSAQEGPNVWDMQDSQSLDGKLVSDVIVVKLRHQVREKTVHSSSC